LLTRKTESERSDKNNTMFKKSEKKKKRWTKKPEHIAAQGEQT